MLEEQKLYAKYAGKAVKGVFAGTSNSIKRELDMMKPRWMLIMATDLCNSRCVHCQIWENKKTHENLTPAEVKTLLSNPIMQGIEYIINTGGEATTRLDLTELLLAEHAAVPNAVINLSTNALMPERAYQCVKALLEAGTTVEIGVSLDGIGSKHDDIREAKGNFEKADWLIKQMKELRKQYPEKLVIGLGSVLIDRTLPNLAEVKQYCENLGVPHTIAWYNATPFYNNTGTNQEHQKEEIIKIVQDMPKNLITEKWLGWMENKPINFKCFSLFDFCVIKSNGDVTPCLTHWNTVAGNIRENTISEIWTNDNPAMLESRKIVRACAGCLNTWGAGWSWKSEQFPLIGYYIRNPNALAMKAKNEIKYNQERMKRIKEKEESSEQLKSALDNTTNKSVVT